MMTPEQSRQYEAQRLRKSAEVYAAMGQPVMALLLNNEAYRVEHQEPTDDVDCQEPPCAQR